MKKTVVVLLALASLACGAAHWIDLVNFIDPATGFCTEGALWARYAVLGALLVLFAAASFMIPRSMAGLAHRNLLLAVCCLLAGLGLAAIAGLGLATELSAKGTLSGLIRSILWLPGAAWFFLAGLSRTGRQAERPSRTALFGVLGTVPFYLLVIFRYMTHSSSIVRVGFTVRLLSSVALLLFVSTLVRALYLPQAAVGRKLFFTGMSAFLLTSCMELPGAVFGFLMGNFTPAELAESAALAFVGLVGLCMAGSCCRARAVKTLPAEAVVQEQSPEPAGEDVTSKTVWKGEK